jgi:outer membrane protein assembly factor BamB
MSQVLRNLFFCLLVAASATAQPTITSISPTTASRSGRVLIQGSGFGSIRGNGHVAIAGVTGLLTRWSDTLIAAYVPESAFIGAGNIQVFDSHGAASNLVPVTVTPRQGQTGQVRWRFQVDADYIPTRPAVGSDGTVYASDSYGHLYAVDSTGGLKWIFNGSGANISVGQDGTIYVGSTLDIVALNPNGTVKWRFTQNPGAFILLGPNVGPDGNIYAVAIEGLGIFSLTPQGTLRWSLPERYDRPIVSFQEIVFGTSAQSRLYFHADRHLRAISLNGSELFNTADALDTLLGDPQPAVAPDGSLYSNLQGPMLGALDDNGNLRWHLFEFSNIMSTVDVGPDGTVYDGKNLSQLYAVNSNGTIRWQYSDSGIMFGAVVSPRNDLLVIGGLVTYGQPGFFTAVSTTGSLIWKELLPVENGFNIWPMSRARITPDGQTAYFGMSIAGQRDNPYTYLYSVQTAKVTVSLASLTLDPTTVVGGSPSTGTITLSGPAPAGGVVVRLSSINPILVNVPASVTVAAGATSATFTARTRPTRTRAVVTVSAWNGSVLKRATLTVTP